MSLNGFESGFSQFFFLRYTKAAAAQTTITKSTASPAAHSGKLPVPFPEKYRSKWTEPETLSYEISWSGSAVPPSFHSSNS